MLSGYDLRKKIVIDHTHVDSNLTDFPLLIKFVDDPDIGANIDASGLNIRFTSSDGETLLKYERQHFSVGGGEATGIFWVKVPTIFGSTNTYIYIYYKSDNPSDGEDSENVWDEDFVAVYHLEQDPTGGTDVILDSTINGNHADSIGSMNSADLIDAVAGKGLDFDGNNDYIETNNTYHTQNDLPFMIEMLFNVPDATTERGIAGSAGFGFAGFGWGLIANDDGTVRFSKDAGGSPASSTSANTYSANTWSYVAGMEAGIATRQVCLNGVDATADTTIMGDQGNRTFQIGGADRGGSSSFSTIKIDEIRFHNSVRSNAWRKFTYRNLVESDNEISLGAEEERPPFLTGWTKRKAIKYGLEIPSDDLTDFPLLIKIISDNDIGTELTARKFAITQADGTTQVPYGHYNDFTVVSFAATGTIRALFDLDSSATENDTIGYLYYDNSAVDQSDRAGLADGAGYELFMPLEEDPSGGAPQMLDWTSNANHGTSGGSMTSGDLAAGQVCNGLDFESSFGGTDYVGMASGIGLAVDGKLTVECIINANSFGASGAFVDRGYWEEVNGWGFYVQSAILRFKAATGGVTVLDCVGTTTLSTGTWYWIAASIDRQTGAGKVFVNGVDDTASFDPDNEFGLSGTAQLRLAAANINGSGYGGIMDEVRVSTVARSADWIAFTYENEFNNEDTFSLGSEEENEVGISYTPFIYALMT